MKTEVQVGAELHMQNFVQFHACFTPLELVVKDKLNCTSERDNTKSQQAQNFDTQHRHCPLLSGGDAQGK